MANTTEDLFRTLFGEVQDSPTAYTVLARLKSVLTGIVLAAGTAIIGKIGFDPAALGQATMANSLPVALASNQSALSVSSSPITTSLGVSNAAFTSADQSGAAAAVTAAPTAGQKLVITDVLVSIGAVAQTITITEETTGTVKLKLYLLASTNFHYKPVGKLKLDTADKKLMVQSSALGAIAVTAQYYSEA